MVTTFNSADMIKFANHIAYLIENGIKKRGADKNYRVTQAEFMDWKDSQTKH